MYHLHTSDHKAILNSFRRPVVSRKQRTSPVLIRVPDPNENVISMSLEVDVVVRF